MRPALVLAGGPVRVTPRVRRMAQEAGLVIAADGGLRHAAALDVRPDLLVGDLDSVAESDLASHADLPTERHSADKDVLDLELAIDAAVTRGAQRVRVVGAFGGRLDQTLAATLIALRYAEDGVRVELIDGVHDALPLIANQEAALALPDGTVFSLLALRESTRVDVSGATYPLDDAHLPRGVGLGLSNRAQGGPTVRVRAGAVVVIVEWDA